jgi:hypothetical protein
VTVCCASPGLDLVIRLDGTDAVVECRPLRPGVPGGWYGNSPAGTHHADAAIALAEDKWRTADSPQIPPSSDRRSYPITPELTDDVAVDRLLRHLNGFEQGPHVITHSRDTTPHVLTPPQRHPQRRSTHVRRSIHLRHLSRTTRMLRVEASDLDQTWRPFISKAVSSPAPLLTF